MQIKLNGHTKTIEEGTTLLDFMTTLGHTKGYVAVAIDQVVIKRELWEDTPLKEGNTILIIGAVKGG
ncbi:MAG: sulfur carrier protein ThiS [Bacteroidales bacterium]|nr:sulfur carrier protein ThiS [Porphyromonas sp.]MDD6934666.1 sulfur carrier protein ThiS [Bacteroidales bacterium]MDY3101584.1 sulfur carrier protein ThiS [Porphyromonas sp.]